MTSLRIGLAQTRQTDDFSENSETIFRFFDQAGSRGVQILCFPEAQTFGYRADISSPDAPVPIDDLCDLHERVARRCAAHGMACILGTETPLETDPSRGKPYNSAAVFSEKGVLLGVHHKTRLTPLDALAYTPGEGFAVFELFGVTVGVVICFEGFRFPESTRECVRHGAQLVFHPQNNTTRPNDWKLPIHESMIVTRAAENTIWFASCNACLAHQNSRSLIVAPSGAVYAQSELKQEQLLVADIDIDQATRAMFNYDIEACAEILFADTVREEEFASILPEAAEAD